MTYIRELQKEIEKLKDNYNEIKQFNFKKRVK